MIPNRALTDRDVYRFAALLRLDGFRGVFMRDTLPRTPKTNECAVVNLDSSDNAGTHWVCYVKRGDTVHYFDSFGNLRPPIELVDYLRRRRGVAHRPTPVRIYYNRECKQKRGSVNCGHLCLQFLQQQQQQQRNRRQC